MPITINGAGSLTGISAGGLPDNCITTAEIAANAVTTAKLGSAEASGLCKAWVNFNGTGTVAIRASYNVSSIIDGGTGIYTVMFTTAMVDANYAAAISIERDTEATANTRTCSGYRDARFAGSFGIYTEYAAASGSAVDMPAVYLSIFR